MARLPQGWKKTTDTSELEVFSKRNYLIHLWKLKKPKKTFIVEPFRKLAGYKRRLFSKSFNSLSESRKFLWNLMRQKEIRGYYLKGEKES